MKKDSPLKTLFRSEIAIGVSLFIATILSLVVANSDGYQTCADFFKINLPLNIKIFGITKDLTLQDWINDGLMAIFFLLVGLELKKEILIGELSTKHKIILPAIAALGGILFPALIFIYCNHTDPENLRGFAVPTATDIAFAYGVISLFGKRISNSLKIFLVALAVLDDLVAILVIAFFYSDNLDYSYLIFSLMPLAGLAFLNLKKSNRVSLYLLLGVVLWLMVLKSGIHATLAGVVLALFIPMQIRNKAILSNLAHKISPTVNFLILPLFAFANAGVRVENFSLEVLSQPIVVGTTLGLFVGKQLGVMLLSFVAVGLKITNLPRGTDWLEFWSAAIFTGIGFTMSLFVGSLAFANNNLAFDQVKIGVLTGSFLSVIFGILVALCATKSRSRLST